MKHFLSLLNPINYVWFNNLLSIFLLSDRCYVHSNLDSFVKYRQTNKFTSLPIDIRFFENDVVVQIYEEYCDNSKIEITKHFIKNTSAEDKESLYNCAIYNTGGRIQNAKWGICPKYF